MKRLAKWTLAAFLFSQHSLASVDQYGMSTNVNSHIPVIQETSNPYTFIPNQQPNNRWNIASNETVSRCLEWAINGVPRSIGRPNRTECILWAEVPRFQYGTASIYLGSDRVFDKPIILVQPYIISLDDSVYTESTFYSQTNPGGFLDSLRASGYDIVLYRYRDMDNGVIYNADGLKVLVERLQRTDSVSSMSVVGLSMGGVVARYALADIEHNSSLEKVATYISYDAPHLGANFPKPIADTTARLLRKVDSSLCGLDSGCRKHRRYIQSIIAKLNTKTFTELVQDSRYHPNNHSELIQQLNEIGHVNSIPTLAITNGSSSDTQGFPNVKTTTHFKLHRKWYNGGSVYFRIQSNPQEDNSPGGYTDFYKFFSETIDGINAKELDVFISSGQKHSFVSTRSALAGSASNFSSTIIPPSNERHMSLS